MKKRLLTLLLSALLLFSAVSCGEQSVNTETATAEPGETETAAEQEVHYPEVENTNISEQLAALPIANDSMSTAELRKLCVDFMRLQSSFRWTPSASFEYNDTHSQKKHSFKKGTVFGGLPYTHASSNIYTWLEYYDEKTGVFDVSSFKPQTLNNFLGNDCADAVFWSWGRVTTTLKYLVTTDMTAVNGCIPKGGYTYDLSIKDFSKLTTRMICEQNGEQTMYKAYASLEIADGVVVYSPSENTDHHTQMVSAAPVVVKNADGSINGKESYILIIDQGGTHSETVIDGKKITMLGGIDRKMTFSKLFTIGYIPFEIAELAGTKPVEKANAYLEGLEEGAGIKEILASNLVSNYRISNVRVRIFDDENKPFFDKIAHGTDKDMYSIAMTKIALRPDIVEKAVPAGTHKVVVTALLSNGENVTVYSSELTV